VKNLLSFQLLLDKPDYFSDFWYGVYWIHLHKYNREKMLADTVEAIIGAIFIDSKYSMNKTIKCIRKIF
jgi:dsRNA-specific ribonuclease